MKKRVNTGRLGLIQSFGIKKQKKRIRMTFCELLLQPILGVVGRKYVNSSLLVELISDLDIENFQTPAAVLISEFFHL